MECIFILFTQLRKLQKFTKLTNSINVLLEFSLDRINLIIQLFFFSKHIVMEDKENLLSFHLHQFSCRNKPLSPFISKLRYLLSCCKHQHAIHWSNDGRSIVITDIEIFKKSVLHNQAEMFKTRNFTSFVRQLNLYGFRKVPSNGKSEAGLNIKFEHAHFRRDRPEMMQFVQRSCFSTGKKKSAESSATSVGSPSRHKETTTNIKPTPVLQVINNNNNVNNTISTSDNTNISIATETYNNNNNECPHSQPFTGPFIIKTLKTNNTMKPPYQTVFAPSRHTLLSTTTATTTTSTQKLNIISLNNLLKNAKSSPSNPVVNNKLLPDEHNYAMASSVEKVVTSFPTIFDMNEDKDVYQFLNENFSAEKEVVQSLLSLPTIQSEHNFDDLKTLAEVSSNNTHLDSLHE